MTPDLEQRKDAGFTLIECLVALVILAVAASGLVGAAQAHIDAVEGLRARTYAQWVAQNRLVEIQLSLPEANARRAELMGQEFDVSALWSKTADPDLAMVVIAVRRPGHRQADALLRGFVDRRTTTP